MKLLIDTQPTSSDVPLEREFEGWITWLIEDYLTALGYEVDVYSFSPQNETHFPADEIVRGKDFGFALQFKRPFFYKSKPAVSWKLDPDQNGLIREIDGIYYALPTYANRRIKDLSLSHFIIWHPGWSGSWMGEQIFATDTQAVLDLSCPNTTTTPKYDESEGLSYSLRWGAFVEYLQRGCFQLTAADLLSSINTAIATGKDIKEKKKEKKAQISNVAKFVQVSDETFTRPATNEDGPIEEDSDGNIVAFLLRKLQ